MDFSEEKTEGGAVVQTAGEGIVAPQAVEEGIMPPQAVEENVCWYAMRDLKRSNAIEPAWQMLYAKGFDVFTPLKDKYVVRGGKRTIVKVPVIPDLLFVRSGKRALDEIERLTPTLQYRFVRGGYYRQPTIVQDKDMQRFIKAVQSVDSPVFYLPEEITPEMIGRTVIIHGGPLDGYEVPLRKLRGSRTRRVFVELPGFVTTEVELKTFDYLEYKS